MPIPEDNDTQDAARQELPAAACRASPDATINGAAAHAALVRHLEDAIVQTAVDGRIVGWSEGAQHMLGYAAGEMLGESIAIIQPAGAWEGAEAYASQFQPGKRQFETRLVDKAGNAIRVRATAFRIDGAPQTFGLIYRDIGVEKRSEKLLLYKDALAGMLQTLVHVANEAESPEKAIAEGLRLICRHKRWQLGHAVVFAPRASRRVPVLTLRHTDDEQRFAAFAAIAGTFDYSAAGQPFLGRVFESCAPVWVTDFSGVSVGPRTQTLLEAGIRSGFAFPVVVAGEILAVLEFFADEPRAPDTPLLQQIERISRCFARMIERQRAANEQAHLAAIVEGANEAIIGRSLDGIITSWNRGAEALLGYSAEDAIGRTMAMTLPAGREFLIEANNERLRRGKTVETQESPRVRKDGTIVHTAADVSPVRDRSGAVVGAAVFLRDISESLRNRKLLVRKVQLNALLQTLTRTANEAATPDAALHECLRLIAEYGRWDAARLLRFDAAGPSSVSVLALVESARSWEGTGSPGGSHWLASGTEPVITGLLDTHDGIWLEDPADLVSASSASIVRRHGIRCAFGFPVVSNGRPLAVLEFFAQDARPRDGLLLENIVNLAGQLARVIEHHQFVVDIAKSEQHLRSILDSEPACVKVVDAAGNLLDMNRAGLEFLEAASVDEIARHGLMNVIAPEYRQRFGDALQRTIAGERCTFEFEIVGLRGSRRWVESHTAPFTAENGAPAAMLSVTRDISDRKRAQERVDHLAHHDALTALPNRSLFQDRLRVAIAHAKRRAEAVGVMIVALDRFRKVNETFGYDVGDDLLRHAATRITSTLRDVDTLARLGADQFAILVEGGNSQQDLVVVADKIRDAFATPFAVAGRELFLTASIGIACYPAHAADAHALLEASERAMNRVKEEGGAGYVVSEGARHRAYAGEYGIETALRSAIRAGELSVHYQPKIDLRNGAITGAEALLRWASAELGMVSPSRFIPIAEETGLIVPIGAWVLETACSQAAKWNAQGRQLNVSVNLSPRQFRQGDLPALVARTLAATGLAPQCLELEITESTAMTNPERAAQVMNELHAIGVKLSVDDFGTGYSSLSYLRQFPLDCLKIDRSFVHDICTSASGEAIVRATVALAHSLDLRVVAEGVETTTQHDLLSKLGCDQGQGFLYGAATPARAFEQTLERAARGGTTREARSAGH